MSGQTSQQTALASDPELVPALAAYLQFEHVVELIREKRDMKLLVEVEDHLHLSRYSPGRIEFEPGPNAPRDLAARLAAQLQAWTNTRWAVSIVNQGGAATLAETRQAGQRADEERALETPLVQAVIATFPGAKISAIRALNISAQTAALEALHEVDEEWDPFEED